MSEQASSAPYARHQGQRPNSMRSCPLQEARRDGIFAGLTSGLAGALLGSRMGFNRNKAVYCGVVTGLLSGYFFTQAFEASNISRINSAVLGEEGNNGQLK